MASNSGRMPSWHYTQPTFLPNLYLLVGVPLEGRGIRAPAAVLQEGTPHPQLPRGLLLFVIAFSSTRGRTDLRSSPQVSFFCLFVTVFYFKNIFK